MSLLAVALATAAFAPITATLNQDGSVRIARDNVELARLSPMVARAGWTFIGFTTAGEGGRIAANVPGGKIEAVAKVGAESNHRFRYELTATPTVDVPIETSGLSLTFGTEWAGGTASMFTEPTNVSGGRGIRLPESFQNTALFTGQVLHAGIGKEGRRIHLEFDTRTNILLQDSRGFGAGFDLRMGILIGSETWPKGQTRRYSVVVGTGEPLTVQESKPLVLEAGPEWIALKPHLDVVPGSALDWAPKKVQPAGSKGWLKTTKDGHFAFEKEPTKPVRFYGANLAFSAAFPDKPTADVLAERLMRLGYNTVRLHHFDAELTGGYQEGPGKSTAIVADVLDRMEYLVAAMKKRGIYTTLDFYTIRKIRRDEIVPGDIGMDEYKGLLLVSEKARENWWEVTRAILEHTNPYTGLKWKDDPAVAWLAVVNENSAGHVFRNAKEPTKKLLNELWQKAGHSGEWTYETDEGARFGAKLHEDAYNWMKAKIRSIGSRALLTDVNGWHENIALLLQRQNLDYVDNHDYWDHPSFLGGDWGLPSRGWSGGGIATKALGGGIVNKALSRVRGLPFSISEFNFTAPNRYRGEGGLLMGSIAARQGWDAMWRFAWSHNQSNIKEPSPIAYFDIQADPAMLASERAIIALFLRGDMPVAKAEKVLKIGPEAAGAKGYSAPVARQLLDVRLYTSTTEGDPNGSAVPLPKILGPVRADTENGILRVDTDRTVGVFGPPDQDIEAGVLRTRLGHHHAALWVSSVDDKPVPQSERLLLTHLTDVQNTGIRYAAQDRDVLTAWGRQPWLVRKGTATVVLSGQQASKWRVWRLDMSGKRVAEVPVNRKVGAISFSVDTDAKDDASIYYEISAR